MRSLFKREALPNGPLARRLLAWDPGGRDALPWRRARDPYRILVSEVMLQQTQVSTVLPYYRRFLRTFPSLRALAAAPLGQVLKAWEGLGYYGRARSLHRLAREVTRKRGGRWPTTFEDWRRLPGIGDYTAGAMASFAFGRDVPALDGNATRVLVRLFGIREDPSRAAIKRELLERARSLLLPGEGRRTNLALMDLGATVCSPRKPGCGACPVSASCQAKEKGIQGRLPVKAPPKPIPEVTAVLGVIRRKGRVLIARRPEKGLLGGLWEFPGGKPKPGEPLARALKREVREETGIEIAVHKPLMTVKHAYSHFRVRLHVFPCEYLSGTPKPLECDGLKWVTMSRLREYPFPKASLLVISRLQGIHWLNLCAGITV